MNTKLNEPIRVASLQSLSDNIERNFDCSVLLLL